MKNSFFKIALSAAVILLTAMIMTNTAQAWYGLRGYCYYADEAAKEENDTVKAWDSARPSNGGTFVPLYGGPGNWHYWFEFSHWVNPGYVRVERYSGRPISPTVAVNLPQNNYAVVDFHYLPWYYTPNGGGEE